MALQQNVPRAVEAGLWFDDGNIILVAEDTPFKVHRSMLSQRSEVLSNILSVPQPPTPDESDLLDGIPVVHVSDTWKEISYVLLAFYQGYKLFGDGKPISFTVVSAFLRLGHKYEIPELQQSAISRLQTCFPMRLSDFKNAKTCDENPEDGYLHFEPPLIHMRLEEVPGVINLARAYDLLSLLPSAFYLCSFLPTRTLIEGSQDEDGNQLLLSKSDITACIDGHITLMQEDIITISSMSGKIAPTCPSESCLIAELFLPTKMDWVSVVKESGGSLDHASWLDSNMVDICRYCKAELKTRWDRHRARTWILLCDTFGIGDTPECWGL